MFFTKKEKYAYVKGIKAGNKGSYTPDGFFEPD